MLNSLPESLDKTYERMLCNINHHLFEDARRIFTLLCFARRPLRVQELIDGVAIEISHPTGFNRRRRLQDSSDIRDICGGFVDIDSTVRISHVSVQQYLESKRILGQEAAKFGLSNVTAHAEIAEICLIYLLDQGLSRSAVNPKSYVEYPLAHYAAMNWFHHYKYTQNSATKQQDLILRLFQCQDSFVTWINLHSIDLPWDHFNIDFNRPLVEIPDPIYYASLLGLHQVLYQLLDSERLKSIMTSDQSLTSKQKVSERINAQGGYYGNALQAASSKGHVEVLQMLLEEGADVHAQCGFYNSTLWAASHWGHVQVVQMLLDNGAEVNDQNGGRGTALHTASCRGHDQVVRILLDKGADVNSGNEARGSPLQEASLQGHDQVVKVLLNKGADINAQDDVPETPLQRASYMGRHQVVKLLLERGATVGYGDALYKASLHDRNEIVQTLLDKRYNANPEDGYFGKALKVASSNGHDKVVHILLDQYHDFTAEELSSALLQAKTNSHESVVQLLQDYEAVLHRKTTATEPA